MGYDYLKLPNQGNIITNLRLLYEMKHSNGFADEHGYFTKRDVTEIGVRSLVVTSQGKAGQEVVDMIDDTSIDELLNSVLQNTKQRLQLLRILGFISTDYDSELYAITEFGEYALQSVFNRVPNYAILMEALMGVVATTEVYEHNCDLKFNCYLGYQICYAFANLDYKIGVKEMPFITTYSIDEIDDFIELVKEYREKGESIPNTHEHFPRTQAGEPLQQASNITRTINQILRIFGIIKKKSEKDGDFNYYVCTNSGKRYVDNIKRNFKNYKFIEPSFFRKKKIVEQKAICDAGYKNVLRKCGFDVETVDKKIIFSPYQLLPESNVNWLLGKSIRRPPIKREDQIREIESHFSDTNLTLKPTFSTQEEYDTFIKTHISKSNIIEEILKSKESRCSKSDLINELMDRHKYSDKEQFYPFVHSILNAMGLDCKGEIGRMDAYIEFDRHVIPAEIKSFTETPAYNLKGLRQAVENKIYSYNDDTDINYASLVIGYNHPEQDTDIKNFIQSAFNELGVKIITCDLLTLIKLCISVVWDEQSVDFNELFNSYGILALQEEHNEN